MFAAQGFIVVAPNYAGYDKSTLPYHPYLNGDQQGKDMVDALTAARKTFPLIDASDAGSLFVTGYSQGGYVALAAHRELQATGTTVTASAPLSAPAGHQPADRLQLQRLAGAGRHAVHAAAVDQLAEAVRQRLQRHQRHLRRRQYASRHRHPAAAA